MQQRQIQVTQNVSTMANVQTPSQRRQVVRVLNTGLPAVEIPTTVNIIPGISSQNQEVYQASIASEKPIKKVSNNNFWLLVTWEANGQSIYHIINASELIGPHFGPVEAGKSIFFRHGNGQIQATIVLISDDKSLVENELTCRIQPVSVQNFDNTSNRKATTSDVNGERVIIARLSRSNQSNDRPMTFDQQTQTETKGDNGNNSDLSIQIANLIEMQKYNEKQLSLVLQQQSKLLELATSNRQNIENVERQILSIVPQIRTTSTILHSAPQQSHFPRDTNIMIKSPNDNLIIDEYHEGDDQVSRMSFNDTSNMSIRSGSLNITDANGLEVLQELEISYKPEKVENASEIAKRSNSQKLEDYTEEADSNYVYLGEYKTKIDRKVFESINWGSYKAVTRKLLISLFPRDILASHSLTGRPSPAFHDRNRPAKDKLDQNIIADIVTTVVKHCKVPESLVRTAITTKCADENKMSRQRLQKRKLIENEDRDNSVKYQISKPDNKENQICLSNS